MSEDMAQGIDCEKPVPRMSKSTTSRARRAGARGHRVGQQRRIAGGRRQRHRLGGFVGAAARLVRGMDPDRAIAFFTFSNTYLALLFAFVAIDVFVRNAIG